MTRRPKATVDSPSIASAAFDVLGCGIVGCDAEHRIGYVNQRLLSLTGYDRDELLDRPIGVLTPPELAGVVETELREVGNGDSRARLTLLRRQDGTTFPAIVLPQHEPSVTPEGMHFAVVIDLAAVQAAKPASSPLGTGLRARLEQISVELQTLGLLVEAPGEYTAAFGHPGIDRLSNREREVVAHMLRGRGIPAISRALQLSRHTVRNHVRSIFRKIGVRSQREVIAVLHSYRSELERRPDGPNA